MTSLKTILAAAMTWGAVSAVNAEEQRIDISLQDKLENCVRTALGGTDIFEKKSSQSYNGYLGHDATTFLTKADDGVRKADETRVTLLTSKTENKGTIWVEAASGSGFSTIMNIDKIDFKFNGAAAEIYEGWTFGKLGLSGGSDASKQDIANVTETVDAIKTSVSACIVGKVPVRSMQM